MWSERGSRDHLVQNPALKSKAASPKLDLQAAAAA